MSGLSALYAVPWAQPCWAARWCAGGSSIMARALVARAIMGGLGSFMRGGEAGSICSL